jgi:putative tryptophan/tyrosine transport system substrate-binding protein
MNATSTESTFSREAQRMLTVRRNPAGSLGTLAIGAVATILLAGCEKKQEAAPAAAAPAAKPVVAMIRAADWMGSEWSEDAIKLGLSEAGLEAGENYELTTSSAQGDLTTLPALLDQARDSKAKVIVTLQDATLQVAVARVKDIPVVFHLLSDPFAIGAGTSDSVHLPNITGVYSPGFGDPEQERRVELIHRTLPKAKKLGILFSPDEALSVTLKDKMTTAAQKAGMTVVVQPIANVGEAGQATQALVDKKVDAIEIYGNAAHTAFESVIQVAKAKKVPVFSSSPFEVVKGALAAFYPDFQEGGVEAGKMIGRILKGESPANIPFFQVKTTKTVVNPNTGVTIPADVSSGAQAVGKPQ